MSVFSDNLTLIRLDRNYTRDDIVEIFDISKYTYRNWEYGIYEPGIKDLIRLSTFLQVSIDEMVGNKPLDKNNIHDLEKFYKNKEALEKQKLKKEKKTTD